MAGGVGLHPSDSMSSLALFVLPNNSLQTLPRPLWIFLTANPTVHAPPWPAPSRQLLQVLPGPTTHPMHAHSRFTHHLPLPAPTPPVGASRSSSCTNPHARFTLPRTPYVPTHPPLVLTPSRQRYKICQAHPLTLHPLHPPNHASPTHPDSCPYPLPRVSATRSARPTSRCPAWCATAWRSASASSVDASRTWQTLTGIGAPAGARWGCQGGAGRHGRGGRAGGAV